MSEEKGMETREPETSGREGAVEEERPKGEDGTPVEAAPVSFGPLTGEKPEEGGGRNLDLLLDVPVNISAEVGRTSLPLERVLDLGPGSVIELDKKSEEPVDVCVNGHLVARGEVVVVDDCYGIRITQIVAPSARLESLRDGGTG